MSFPMLVLCVFFICVFVCLLLSFYVVLLCSRVVFCCVVFCLSLFFYLGLFVFFVVVDVLLVSLF